MSDPNETPVADLLHPSGGELLVFNCPGCEESHGIPVFLKRGYGGPLWSWNRSLTKPTCQPSILVTHSHPKAGIDGNPPARCHSYVTDGMIQFLPDSTHKLSGKTVPLPPVN